MDTDIKIKTEVLDGFFGCNDVLAYTDKYFTKTKNILSSSNTFVTYAVFMRRPVRYAVGLALSWLRRICANMNVEIKIKENYKTGDWVGAGEPLFYYTAKFADIVELETMLLQMVGVPCVCAYNAYEMAKVLPKVSFMAMEARHCTGKSMMHLAAYGASVGSLAAQKDGAAGFIGSANDATAYYFDKENGLGTMPHALIGWAGSTLEAAIKYHTAFPDEQLVVLCDYFAKEVSDALKVCRYYEDLAKTGRLSFRMDTHGGRYVEGLDRNTSYAVLERNCPSAIKELRSENELKYLIGTGVSAAAVWYMRESLDRAGFDKVKLVASSGFTVEKCRAFATAKAPVDVIGTGSYLPQDWMETYTTADVVKYDTVKQVKSGREFLFVKLED